MENFLRVENEISYLECSLFLKIAFVYFFKLYFIQRMAMNKNIQLVIKKKKTIRHIFKKMNTQRPSFLDIYIFIMTFPFIVMKPLNETASCLLINWKIFHSFMSRKLHITIVN